jgi:hypothetical protein
MDNKYSTIIGKDVIESLTIGMYEDSRFIFREYIQNSADQIDKAKRDGIVDDFCIHISILPETKTIIFEDNATGISLDNVQPILKNIASSTKTRGVDKGFRGIGRLGGLGYCEKIIFETSFSGEDKMSIMTWDATLLKKIINDRKNQEEATKVIDDITELRIEKAEKDERFFRVILKGVSNVNLLNKNDIRKYLSLVAPVPFPKKFIFEDKIYKELQKENLSIDEYKIIVNEEQLYKGYSNYIYEGTDDNKKGAGEIIDVAFMKEYDKEKNLLYWGWYGISDKIQSLNQVNFSRGFRLRKSNIQVGDEYTLAKLHRDKRFQNYFIGEIHAFHNDLIPNARRDYFSENETYNEFENTLKSYFYNTINKLCYKASEIHSSIRKIEDYNKLQNEIIEITNNKGFTDKNEKEDLLQKLERKKLEAISAESKIQKIKEEVSTYQIPIKKIIDRVEVDKTTLKQITVEEDNEKPKFRTDNLSKLNKEQRKFLSTIFTIIKNALPNETAENLIKKIEEEYK